MKKNYFILFTISLLGNLCFSQTKIAGSAIAAMQATNNPMDTMGAVSAKSSPTATVFAKTPLPKNQKNTPVVFYIVNDSAVDYKTYIHTLRKTQDKR